MHRLLWLTIMATLFTGEVVSRGAAAHNTIVEKILTLEQEAEFAEAIRLCDEALTTSAGGPDAALLREKLAQLKEEKKLAPSLSVAMRQLGSDNPQALDAAKDELANGGEAALIYLRKAVRNEKGQIATVAAGLLEEHADARTLATLVARLKKEPSGTLTPALIKAIGACIRGADPANRKALAGLFVPLCAVVESDSDFSRRDMAGLLIQVLFQWFDGDAASFEAGVGKTGLYATLKDYVKKAPNSANPDVLAWYADQARLFGLETALMGWWAFDDRSGTTAKDSSGQGNDGKITGGAAWAPGAVGGALRLDGASAFVSLGNPKVLQITNDTTIAMWLKPSMFDVRRNPYNKAYGGEGTMTLEPSGLLNFFCGSSGADLDPYQTFGMTDKLVTNQWAHIALVRDSKQKKLYWYKNGKRTDEADTPYPTVRASAQGVFIGKGYVSPFAGLMDDVRIYSRALSGEDIRCLYAAGEQQAQ